MNGSVRTAEVGTRPRWRMPIQREGFVYRVDDEPYATDLTNTTLRRPAFRSTRHKPPIYVGVIRKFPLGANPYVAIRMHM